MPVSNIRAFLELLYSLRSKTEAVIRNSQRMKYADVEGLASDLLATPYRELL